jgi:sugar lactone lactonase YvrE
VKRLLLLVLCLPLAAPAAASGLPREYLLPGERVFPEGVTVRPGSDQFFVSSTNDGTIFRGTLRRERLKPFLPPGRDGRTLANGVRATRDHLIVAGSVTGLIFVYDIRSGDLVRRFATGSGGLVNDVAVTPSGDVYATDSRRGLLFRIRARAARKRVRATTTLRPFVRLSDTPIGSYSNGLVPAGSRYMLVVGLSTGVLGRVDLETRKVRVVRGVTLPAGDGLARTGRTLYAVTAASRVTQVTLARNWLSGTVRRQITSARFRLPTTVAIAGRRLLVVNSQFDERAGTPELPFTVSAVARP